MIQCQIEGKWKKATGRALRNKRESDDCNTATSRKQHMAVINNKEISPTVETIGVSVTQASTCMMDDPIVATHINADMVLGRFHFNK